MVEAITFIVENCSETGGYVARWDEPLGRGGITTQGDTISELQEMISDAVRGFFEPDEMPDQVKLHFSNDPILQVA
jgi:predicted RNase H-like HicB family nuclease